ncbi:MAG TPA: cytochrome c [Saprospiraceae bacterium]|nr:cytochrome c [Saprospiraceae bacterium]HPI09242.1 cytochrome c [Saprospiraceae bacterium]
MKKIVKRVGSGILALLALTLLAGFIMGLMGRSNFNKTRTVQPREVPVPTDSASIAAGQQWASVLCTGCHGENYAGSKFMDVPALGMVCAPNLTPAGIGRSYRDADWVRSIRHGLNPEGKAFVIMPSENFQHLSDEHLGQLIAYLKLLPPVEQTWPARHFTFLSMAMYQAGAMGLLPTDKIDHLARHPTPVKSETPDYGRYLADLSGCSMCHGSNLKGGTSPDAESPPCPDISATSAAGRWGNAGFIQALRMGVTPQGKALNPKFMPWREHGRMDDVQLRAIYAYLMSAPDHKN